MTNSGPGYVLEDAPEGRWMVVTGPWSAAATEVLQRGEADGLVLNYARGFVEEDLEFLEGGWSVRRLKVLDRGISDLVPIGRLGGSLEALSVQAAPRAGLDLGVLPHLLSISGEWALLRQTLGTADALQRVITWKFDETDLHAFRDHVGLQKLTIKEAPHLESLAGVTDLPDLAVLSVFLARRLSDISDITGLASSLQELELEDCPGINAIDDVESLVNLGFFGISECGEIESLAPVALLRELETLHAWGSTRVVDGDLTPLTRLPRLKEVRMRNRRDYKPRVADIVSTKPS